MKGRAAYELEKIASEPEEATRGAPAPADGIKGVSFGAENPAHELDAQCAEVVWRTREPV